MNHQRLSSPSIVMESQINGNFGENSSSSSSNSSAAYPANSSSDTSSIVTKPYKPKFHNYKKLDLSKATTLQTNNIAPISTPSTPSTPSFFSANAGNLVRRKKYFFICSPTYQVTLLLDTANNRRAN
jgi:hypothetical protein